MKLKLPTIIFGAALSAVALGSQASAANLNVSNKMTGSATIGGIGAFSVSASGSTAGIEATDYVEFDYYNIQIPSFLSGSNVAYNGQIVGKVSVTGNHHASKTQNKDVDDSVTPYYSDGKIRVTFSENIAKFDSINFTISGQNGADVMDVDRAYTLNSWISLNSQRLAVKTTNIAAVRPVDLTQTCLRAGGIYFDIEGRQNSFNFHLDNAGEAPFKAGDKVKIIIPESSPIRFKSYAGSEPKMTHHFNFISVDTPKNVHGVYFTRTTPNPKVRISAIVGNEMDIEILEDFPAKDGVYYTGVNNIFEVIRYENITNNSMPINATYQTFIDGQKTCEKTEGRVTFNGAGVEVFLKEKIQEQPTPEVLKEELKNEEKLEESPKEKSDPSPEIQAPNTGAQSGIFPILLSGATILGVVSVILWRRRG